LGNGAIKNIKGEGMNSQQFFEMISRENHIIIYGAGMVGELVYKCLRMQGCVEKVTAFAVTDPEAEQSLLGKKVLCIERLKRDCFSGLIVIATLPPLHEEIMATLTVLGFRNVLRVETELYEELKQFYISEFLNRQDLGDRPIDVVFMASDNDCTSGAFLSMADLNLELRKRGLITIIILPTYGTGERILQERGITYTYLLSEHWAIPLENPEREKKAVQLRQNGDAIQALEEFLKLHHVKLVHNNTTYTYAGAVAAKHVGIPIVWHLREFIQAQGFTFWNSECAFQLINSSDAIITVSSYLSSCYPALRQESVHVVYNGVDLERYYRERMILSEGEVSIILVGAITPWKGQEELINAAKLLKDEGLQFSIRFVGHGKTDYVTRLRELARSCGLEHEIIFCGRRDDVRELYWQSDIAVMSSSAEAFGRVTVEAQLAGCLVIGADAGATPELIKDGETGLLYQQGNCAALKEKILMSVQDVEESRKIARNGQRNAYQTFSKDNNAENILHIYKKILKK